MNNRCHIIQKMILGLKNTGPKILYNGTFLTSWEDKGEDGGQFLLVHGLAIDYTRYKY
jgi:hypothetical protein